MSLLSNELDFFLAVKGFDFNPEAGILMRVLGSGSCDTFCICIFYAISDACKGARHFFFPPKLRGLVQGHWERVHHR